MLSVHAPNHLAEEGRALQAKHPTLHGHLFATSGTTGKPKWILHSQAGLDHCARVVNQQFDCTAQDTWGLALPEVHVGGFCLAHRAHLAGGRLTRFSQRWHAEEFTQWLTSEGVTITSLVPTQVFDLIKSEQIAPPNLRLALIGGDRLPGNLFNKALELGWPLAVSYGMTETAGLIASSRIREQSLRPLPSWTLDTDEQQLLTIAGSGLFSGYVTAEGLSEPPSPFTTTDLVEISEERLHILGRQDDQIKILGELVDVQQLKNRLASVIPEITTTILALPEARRGHLLFPVIEGSESEALVHQVTSWNKTLPAFSRLQAPLFFSPWPRTSLGKLDRKALEAELRKRHSSSLPPTELKH